MKESEYILVGNLKNVSIALQTIRDILPDFDGVTTTADRQKVLEQLSIWQDKLYKKVKVTEDK